MDPIAKPLLNYTGEPLVIYAADRHSVLLKLEPRGTLHLNDPAAASTAAATSTRMLLAPVVDSDGTDGECVAVPLTRPRKHGALRDGTGSTVLTASLANQNLVVSVTVAEFLYRKIADVNHHVGIYAPCADSVHGVHDANGRLVGTTALVHYT